jgi:flagellin
MPLRIFNNLNSKFAQNRLNSNNEKLGKVIGRVSSGERVQKNSDDGASHAIAESLNSDARTIHQALRNLQSGISLINVAESGLTDVAGMLNRSLELASQASTGTTGFTERKTLQLEYDALKQEINRIANTSEFSGQNLLDGSLAVSSPSEDIIIHMGLDSSDENRVNLNDTLNLEAITTTSLGIDTLDMSNAEGAKAALEKLQEAIDTLINARGRIGATHNSLTRVTQSLGVNMENITAAESTIRDSDIAQEVTGLTKQLLLTKSSAAMIGQSNLIPEGVLLLLQ